MDKQSDLLSNYVAKAVINNSVLNNSPDAEMESEHSSDCKQAVSDLVHTSETRKWVDVPVQEINIVTLDDSLSGVERPPSVDNRPLSCSVSVSTANIRNISARSEETEFITAAMFKTFLDSHNKQMDTIQHSLGSLNSTYYDEYEDYEDEEEDNYDSEDEPPRKISRSDTFLSVASGSGIDFV